MPIWLFQAPPAQHPHPNYPLLLPLVESWFYGWMRSPNQGFVKLVSPLFYVAITFSLFAAGARVCRRKWRAPLPALLFFFLPWAVLRTTAGEADIPIAAYYTATCIYLLEFVVQGDRRILILSGVLAALLPWVKREGVILWVVLLVLALIVCLSRRDLRSISRFALPGLVWIIIWRVFLYLEHATFQPEYLPVSFETLRTNVVRVPTIVRSVFSEMCDWKHWSLVWVIPVIGVFQCAIRRQRLTLIWLAMVIAPWSCIRASTSSARGKCLRNISPLR